MYLKSLVLKGFKSFADRSVLTLEPGITAIVGPNGSGKSNISDAVLWVLGERNARNLRGQAMEDVIFAGSSARKATGVAEVELVLDNSDGTLPVEYREVSIARRMYRSGESEYLINGTLARRMDVLDILHDSGLGTGTHSIISQGSLDSILRSDAADRRALIEEAAGVLKHKQRKAKSERKLEKMETHVARVRDVVGEVERQLGPLSRKAKRAQTYAAISAELAEIKLDLAVDDLRQLRVKWDACKERTAALSATVQAKRTAIDEAEAHIERVQEQMRAESADVGALSRSHQACSSAADHLDSTLMLMRDRKRQASARAGELRMTLETSKARRETALGELAQANAALESARLELARVRDTAGELAAQEGEAGARLEALAQRGAELAAANKAAEAELADLRRIQAERREAQASRTAYLAVLEEQVNDAQAALLMARADAEAARAQAETTTQAMERIAEQEKAAAALVASCVTARETTRSALDDARAAEQSLAAQVDALEEMERASVQSAGAARAWIAEHAARLRGNIEPLSAVVKANDTVETLTELLLSADVMSLLIDDAEDVSAVLAQLPDDEEGEVTFLLRRDASRATTYAAQAYTGAGHALLDDLSYPSDAASAVMAALGDVIVCESLSAALAAHKADRIGLRFTTAEGDIVWPFGKVTVGSAADGGRGVLARARRMKELRAGLEQARRATTDAIERASAAESELTQAQNDSLDVSRKLALMRGNAQSDATQADEAQARAVRAEEELATLTKRSDEAHRQSQEDDTESQKSAERIAQLESQLEERGDELDSVEARLAPLRHEVTQIQERHAETKLSLAKMEERAVYAERMASRRADDVEELAHSDAETEALLRAKELSATRLEPLIALFEGLSTLARERALRAGEEATRAQQASSSIHERMVQAREAAQQAHHAYDEVSEQLNENRVESARLEMQVEAAVTAIVEECATPVDVALARPALEDRAEAEEASFKLTRRIANLGTINPDAAQEYSELKERFDYLSGQLADLDSARRALMRINRVIDVRMKDDFANTYAQVNENFQAIFSTLFPGGQGHLSLDAPDDLENSGVEVNAQPAGKRITKMSLMSGGEKSLVALALLFAVYKTRSTPFYILDEVEAALDDTNLRRLSAYIDSLRDATQLIMITHQRRTMEMADVLFGVSMQADGVTKVISQKLDRALEYAE